MASLEQAIDALRDEVQKLTAITTKLLDVRADAIETVKNAAASPTKATKKPEPEKAEPAKEEVAKAEPEKVEREVATQTPDADDLGDDAMKEHVASYVNFGYDDGAMPKEEREARMTKVKEVLAHPKVNAKTVAEVPQNARNAFRKKIDSFIDEIKENGPLTGKADASADLDDI